MELTEGIKSPPSFRLWGAITTLCAIAERRVWTTTDSGILYPNMYNVLAGNPGSGKTLSVVRSAVLLSNVNGLHLAPDNPTKPTFLDSIEHCLRTVPYAGDLPLIYSAISVHTPELGVFLPERDSQFIADLTHIYDNPDKYKAPRRTTRSIDIESPTVNILAAATPSLLNDILPETAWSQGFSSRLIFTYGIRPPNSSRNIFAKKAEIDFAPLIKHLNEYFNDLVGEFNWEPGAQTLMNAWMDEGMPPVPTYARLVHYNSRREVHVLKLAMISAISAQRGLTVTCRDFERAKRWLLEVESTMPDVFRAMAQRSDQQLLLDLHVHLFGLYSRQGRDNPNPIPESKLALFLEDKVTAERIPILIKMMETTGRMKRGAFPNEWIPATLF